MKLKNIVVATDFSDNSLPALETGFNLAQETHSTLYLLHVIELPISTEPVAPIWDPMGRLQEEGEERLRKLVPDNLGKDVRVKTETRVGRPSHEVAEFAREKAADMIIVGTHGRRGLARVLMGSTAEALLREAPCQVLVVKPKAPEPSKVKVSSEG